MNLSDYTLWQVRGQRKSMQRENEPEECTNPFSYCVIFFWYVIENLFIQVHIGARPCTLLFDANVPKKNIEDI